MRSLIDTPNEGNPFFVGFDSATLVKAEEQGSNWIVFLEASNESRDQEDDIIVMKALKDAADYYLSKGVISWDHQHKLQKSPEYIIGEPLDIAFTESKSTLVKGKLYKENKRAQGLWENLLSKSSRFGASVGGYILKKSLEGGQKFIRKVIFDDVAVTHKPVNDTTLGHVQLVPFSAFAKSLTAGTGVNPSEFSAGRALTTENLQGDVVKLDSAKLDKMFKAFLKGVKEGTLIGYEDTKSWIKEQVPSETTANQIMDFILSKLTKKA